MVFNKKAIVDAPPEAETPKATGTDGPVPKPAKPPKVKIGICEFCGNSTKGGRFCPGHDSKLKSQLIKQVREGGNLEAGKKLIERAWGTREYVDTLMEQYQTKLAKVRAKEIVDVEKLVAQDAASADK